MATDGPTPNPCDPKIFQNGKSICVVHGSSNAVERWVQSIAKKANAKVDWHYACGQANVLHLGDENSRQRVIDAIKQLEGELDGNIISVEDPNTVVCKINGKLYSPAVVAVISATEKNNCKITLQSNTDRVEHFKSRINELNMTPDQAVIVCLNVDDVHGSQIAEALMPGHDWQAIRDEGKTPFALGIAVRDGIREAIDAFDKDAATKLMNTDEISVVVVDHGVAEVFVA